jgi:hypothetical protein
MSIELYREYYNQNNQMVAKVMRNTYSNSKKLTQVHISPVEIEHRTGYSMEVHHSGSRCIRLVLSKPYTAAQLPKIKAEIRTMAADRLLSGMPNTEEGNAFYSALLFLSKLPE